MSADHPDAALLAHYREWMAAEVAVCRYPANMTTSEWEDSQAHEDLEDRVIAEQAAMAKLTATTREGLAALVHTLWDFVGPYPRQGTAEFEDELNSSAEARLCLALWRSVTGSDGYPPVVAVDVKESAA